MDADQDYRTLNRANWDERAGLHAGSAGYGLQRYVDDPQRLSDVVRFDRPRLGEIGGLRTIHLQCHLGTDTLSLARLGAVVTGLDFSAVALKQARALARRAGTRVDYLQADVYDAVAVAGAGAYDLVYTGIGALCWLPDIRRWAEVVAELLAPGGRLFLREGHPVLWSVGQARPDGLITLEDTYFEQPDPLVVDDDGSYVDTAAPLNDTVTHEWNHGLGEVVTALLAVGMRVTGLVEHDSAPWEALPGLMIRDDRDEWRLRDRPERLPCTYTLQAVKPGPG